MSNGKTKRPFSALILLSGLPGAGKTTFAHRLREKLDAEHVESDAIRRALAAAPRYDHREHARVFGTAERELRAAFEAGRPVIFDATNLTTRDRRRFLRLAHQCDVRVVAVRLVAPEATIRERLAQPREGWSQATVEVFEQMRSRPQPFRQPVVVADTRFDLRPTIDLVCALVGAASDP